MKNENNTLETLIKGGLIGAALGAIFSKDKSEGAGIGALLGAIIATYQANLDARDAKLPVYVEDQGKIYEIQPDGKRKYIKDIDKSRRKLPEHFKLKK